MRINVTNGIRQDSAGMIGRDEELGRLSALLARARNGDRQLALVTGEAGLGKSRLLAEASSAAIAQGFEVLTGLCHPGDHAIPFAPFVDAIRQRIGGSSTSDARAFLGSAWQPPYVQDGQPGVESLDVVQ